MKTIVTHMSLDLDSITSSWLVKKFMPGFQKARIAYVPAGSSLDKQPPDSNPDIIHVDTGLGQFDHHQTSEYTSATKLVFQYLVKHEHLQQKAIAPLERLVNFVNDIDHFAEVYFPDSTSDIYEFGLPQIIEGLKASYNDEEIIIIVWSILEAVIQVFRNKIRAEEDIKRSLSFQSVWGKSIAIESKNEESVKLALKMRYNLVVRKDPIKGNVRIKTLPEKKLDLTPLYQKIKSADKKGTWFLHISKNMLLNSSSKNPHFTPTPLLLNQIIDIIKSVK